MDNKIDLTRIRDTEIEAIRREIDIHSKLRHSNIVTLHEVIQDGTKLYLLLDYAEKGNLFDLIRKGDMSRDEIFKIINQIGSALEYLHSNKIVHRDLKPENILINFNNDYKLCDFGFCAFYENEPRQTLCGTKEYLSPEVIANQEQNDKLDVWCFGILVYELSHRRPPYKGKNIMDLYNEIQTKRLEFKENFCPILKKLIKLCLNVDYRTRPSMEFIMKFFREHTSTMYQSKSFAVEAKETSLDNGQGGKETIKTVIGKNRQGQLSIDQSTLQQSSELSRSQPKNVVKAPSQEKSNIHRSNFQEGGPTVPEESVNAQKKIRMIHDNTQPCFKLDPSTGPLYNESVSQSFLKNNFLQRKKSNENVALADYLRSNCENHRGDPRMRIFKSKSPEQKPIRIFKHSYNPESSYGSHETSQSRFKNTEKSVNTIKKYIPLHKEQQFFKSFNNYKSNHILKENKLTSNKDDYNTRSFFNDKPAYVNVLDSPNNNWNLKKSSSYSNVFSNNIKQTCLQDKNPLANPFSNTMNLKVVTKNAGGGYKEDVPVFNYRYIDQKQSYKPLYTKTGVSSNSRLDVSKNGYLKLNELNEERKANSNISIPKRVNTYGAINGYPPQTQNLF